MESTSSVGSSWIVRLDYRKDNSFTVTSIAMKGPKEDTWERINVKSDILFKTIDSFIRSSASTYNLTYLTKEEAFVEII